MKRTLATILSLILIMIAFTACGDLFNDSDDLETVVVPPSSAEPQTGDLVLQEYDPMWTNVHYSGDPIKRGDFTIGFHGLSPYPNTTTPLDTFGLKMQISRDEGSTWQDVTFDSTKYGPASSGHVYIKVSQTNGNKSKIIKVEVITLKG